MKIEKKFVLIVDDEPDMLWALDHTFDMLVMALLQHSMPVWR